MIDCNIIIPTYNRPTCLRRLLDYYDSFGEGFKIIVADSSSDENKKLNKEIISAVFNLDIKYLDNYPHDINPHHKIAHVVSQVETEYCVLCADDDFVTPDGIKQSIDFLENNTDFAVAHGRYITFYLEDDGGGKEQFCWKPADSHESITFSDSKDRLNRHLSHYSQSTAYGVHRTELLKLAYKETSKFTIDPMLFGELCPSMLTLIYGKMKCLDVFYAARDGYLKGYWPTLRDAVEAGTFDEEYAKFRDCLSEQLSKQSQLDIEESRKIVDEAMSAYMKRYYPSKSKMGYILDSLKLSDWLNRGIRRSYTELTRSRRVKKYSVDMPPSSKYYDDFNRIHLHVLSYSKIQHE